MAFKVAWSLSHEPYEVTGPTDVDDLMILDSGWVAIKRGNLTIYYPPQAFEWIEEQ